MEAEAACSSVTLWVSKSKTRRVGRPVVVARAEATRTELAISVAAARSRLDPTIQTSVLNTYSLRCDWELIVRDAAETDPDLRALALYRLGRKAEAVAAWPGMPDNVAPVMKLWNDTLVAHLSDAPEARGLTERLATFDVDDLPAVAGLAAQLGDRQRRQRKGEGGAGLRRHKAVGMARIGETGDDGAHQGGQGGEQAGMGPLATGPAAAETGREARGHMAVERCLAQDLEPRAACLVDAGFAHGAVPRKKRLPRRDRRVTALP
jgi:hypothetical protein